MHLLLIDILLHISSYKQNYVTEWKLSHFRIQAQTPQIHADIIVSNIPDFLVFVHCRFVMRVPPLNLLPHESNNSFYDLPYLISQQLLVPLHLNLAMG